MAVDATLTEIEQETYWVSVSKNRYGERRGVKMRFKAAVNQFEEVA